MAEVVAAHQMLAGGGWFACSNTECGWKLRNTLSPREFHFTAWPVQEHANHVAEMLAAHGYGKLEDDTCCCGTCGL